MSHVESKASSSLLGPETRRGIENNPLLKPKVKPKGGGWQITDRTGSLWEMWLLLGSAFVFALMIGAQWVFSPSWSVRELLIAATVFAFFGMLGGLTKIHHLWSVLALGPATLWVDQWPVVAGSTVRCRFTRRARVRLPVQKVRAVLVGVSLVQRRISHSHSYLEGVEMHRQELPDVTPSVAGRYDAEWTAVVPPSLPVGIDRQWRIEVLLEGEKGPVCDAVFVLKVKPRA